MCLLLLQQILYNPCYSPQICSPACCLSDTFPKSVCSCWSWYSSQRVNICCSVNWRRAPAANAREEINLQNSYAGSGSCSCWCSVNVNDLNDSNDHTRVPREAGKILPTLDAGRALRAERFRCTQIRPNAVSIIFTTCCS